MFEINMKPPLYDPEAVQPMRDELVFVGFQETRTPQQVDDVLSQKNGETVFVVINSVCGCAAGSARPAATLALQHHTIPDKFITVFAGMDRDAVDFLREKFLSQYPPSSPSMALFENGELVYFLPRHRIEGRYPEEIAEELKSVFDKYCKRKGPSISPEKYAQLVHAISCGSKIQINT